jgi:hypothetical protein
MPIQYIDNGSTQGYQVRVGPRHACLTKFFAVRKSGGRRKAKARARAAELELQELALPVSRRDGARRVAPANNTSGVVGIRPRQVLFSERPCLYFVASWSIRGKPFSTSFSAQRHGKIGALSMAMARREQATGTTYDLTPRQAFNRMKHLLDSA